MSVRASNSLLIPTLISSVAFACFPPQGAAEGPAGSATGRPKAQASARARPAGPRGPNPAPALAWDASLPLLPEDKPRSIRYRQAMLRWRTATVAFSLGRFERAADSFIAVADALKTERPHPHASTFAAARCLAYENAGRALAEVEDQPQAVQKLENAVAGDATCPYTVRRAFRSLTHHAR